MYVTEIKTVPNKYPSLFCTLNTVKNIYNEFYYVIIHTCIYMVRNTPHRRDTSQQHLDTCLIIEVTIRHRLMSSHSDCIYYKTRNPFFHSSFYSSTHHKANKISLYYSL